MSGIEGWIGLVQAQYVSAYSCLALLSFKLILMACCSGFKLNGIILLTLQHSSEYGSVFNIRVLTSSEAPVARGASKMVMMLLQYVVGKQAITHINPRWIFMNLIYRDPYYSGMLAQNATLAVICSGASYQQDTAIRNLLSTDSHLA